jgi:hypothetical protein
MRPGLIRRSLVLTPAAVALSVPATAAAGWNAYYFGNFSPTQLEQSASDSTYWAGGYFSKTDDADASAGVQSPGGPNHCATGAQSARSSWCGLSDGPHCSNPHSIAQTHGWVYNASRGSSFTADAAVTSSPPVCL